VYGKKYIVSNTGRLLLTVPEEVADYVYTYVLKTHHDDFGVVDLAVSITFACIAQCPFFCAEGFWECRRRMVADRKGCYYNRHLNDDCNSNFC
jgi:hypothetical protein